MDYTEVDDYLRPILFDDFPNMLNYYYQRYCDDAGALIDELQQQIAVDEALIDEVLTGIFEEEIEE